MESPLNILKNAEGMEFVDEDGEKDTLRLLPPLTEAELQQLEAEIPCKLPPEMRELFSYTRGFEGGPLECVDFTGLPGGFGLEEVSPHAVSIAGDGCGNFWIVDLTSQSTSWSPIFYACHDPPVFVFQTDSLFHFIIEVLRLGNPPYESEIDVVHESAAIRIWDENPGLMNIKEALASPDTVLRTFAESLDETYLIKDLRKHEVGDGFSWGRYEPEDIARYGEELIFALEGKEKVPWYQRLFNKG